MINFISLQAAKLEGGIAQATDKFNNAERNLTVINVENATHKPFLGVALEQVMHVGRTEECYENVKHADSKY